MQNRLKCLRKHDAIFAVGFSEDFAVEARVTETTPEAAVLGGMRIIAYSERTVPLFSDDKFRVRWTGTGYIVERKADGVRMGAEHGSEELAVRHIRALHPQKVA